MNLEYKKVVVNKTEVLKHIIKEHLGKDINKIGRKSELVEARFIYFYILRESEKITFQKIADTLNMNHASVLHGYKKAKYWIETDYKFKDKYLTVLSNYTKSVYGIQKQKELINKIKEFEEEYEKENKSTSTKLRPIRREGKPYDKLHILIDKTPEEKVESLLERVQAIFNMMQSDLKRQRV